MNFNKDNYPTNFPNKKNNLINKNYNFLKKGIVDSNNYIITGLFYKFCVFMIFVEALISKIKSMPIINIDNVANFSNTSNYISNSRMGFLFYVENVLRNLTDESSASGIEIDVSSSFVKIGKKTKIELVPKSYFNILNSAYITRNDENLTLNRDYNVNFDVDESISPFDGFKIENSIRRPFDSQRPPSPSALYSQRPPSPSSLYSQRPPSPSGPRNNSNMFPRENRDFDLVALCDYSNKGILFEANLFNYKFTYKKIENILGLNFALTNDNKIERVIYEDGIISSVPVTEYVGSENTGKNYNGINNITFDDFYLVNQLYESGTFIFGLKSSSIIVYNITGCDFLGNYLTQIFAEVDLNQIFIGNTFYSSVNNNANFTGGNNSNVENIQNNRSFNGIPTITKYGTFGKDIWLGTLEYGLVRVKINNNSNPYTVDNFPLVNFNSSIMNLKVRDMSINNSTIYVICDKLGLKIFDIQSLNFTDFEFYHPHLIKFDSVFPQNTQTPLYGILIDNGKPNVNEFFLELRIGDADEKFLEINRIYLSSYKSGESNYYSKDENKNGLISFTNQINTGIVFDKLNQRLIFLTRGIPNFIETQNFKINFSKIKQIINQQSNTNSKIIDEDFYEVFFLSARKEKFEPYLILRGKNSIISINQINFSNNTFTCEFESDGYYQINFIYKTVCKKSNSRDFYDNYRSCPILLSIPISVLGGMNIAIWIIVGIIVILLICLIAFIICCFKGKSSRSKEGIKYSQHDNNSVKNKDDVIEVQIIDTQK